MSVRTLIAALAGLLAGLPPWGRADDGPPPSRPIDDHDIALTSHEENPSDDTPTIELPQPASVPIAEVSFEESISSLTDAAQQVSPLDLEPPHWANDLIDQHALIYRETRSEIEILGGGGSFGMTSLGFSGSVADDEEGPLWLETKFGWHFLNGPAQPDVRPQFYDLALEINLAQPINDVWSVYLQATPTWASDFDNKDSEAFRMIGGGLLAWQLSPEWTLVGGGTYLDREDLPWLPIAGLRLATDDLELDLLVPRPRFALRTDNGDDDDESWIYVAGEIGGGSWAFEREDSGRHDVFNYRDLRLMAGFESREADGARHVFEAGYIFDRQIEYADTPGRLTPGDTWLLRWGTTY